MGSMKTDYIKAKEREQEKRRQQAARWRRSQEATCTAKQADYITGLGGRAYDWTPDHTAAWALDTFVPHYAREDARCLMDLTKTEASQAIARLKKEVRDA